MKPRRPPASRAARASKAATPRPHSGAHQPETPVAGVVRPDAGKSHGKAPAPQTGLQLHSADGLRKYLTAGERDRFLRAAEQANRPVHTLCITLAYAGCQLSKALALTAIGSTSPPACWCSKV